MPHYSLTVSHPNFSTGKSFHFCSFRTLGTKNTPAVCDLVSNAHLRTRLPSQILHLVLQGLAQSVCLTLLSTLPEPPGLAQVPQTVPPAWSTLLPATQSTSSLPLGLTLPASDTQAPQTPDPTSPASQIYPCTQWLAALLEDSGSTPGTHTHGSSQ